MLLPTLPSIGQEVSLNRVADGSFEGGVVSLSLPPVAHFPLFSGGWASRGRHGPEIVGDAFEGNRALRISTRPDDPTQLIQDLPFNSAGFAMRVAFMIESGNQTVRVLTDWDRSDPSGGDAAFEATISADGLSVTTPAGRWDSTTTISQAEWHELSVVVDPRHGTQSVRLDGSQVLSLPGVAARQASTLLIGAGAGDDGTFRYDSVELVSLVDLEMSILRDAATALVGTVRDPVLDRLNAADTALRRGAPTLAIPELGVVHNLLGSSMRLSPPDRPEGTNEGLPAVLRLRMQLATANLIALIELERPANSLRREPVR